MAEQRIREALTKERLEVELREEMGLPTPEEKAAAMAEAQAGPEDDDGAGEASPSAGNDSGGDASDGDTPKTEAA